VISNKDLLKIFEYALHQEETGKDFFTHSLKRVKDRRAKSALNQLIEEEKRHIELINRFIKGLKDGTKISVPEIPEEILIKESFFNDQDKSDFLETCIIGSSTPDACIFKTAYLIEKDLAKFYDEMAENSEGPAQKALRMLARWEKEHAAFFKEYRDRLEGLYINMYS
jgi:rubrerythrin